MKPSTTSATSNSINDQKGGGRESTERLDVSVEQTMAEPEYLAAEASGHLSLRLEDEELVQASLENSHSELQSLRALSKELDERDRRSKQKATMASLPHPFDTTEIPDSATTTSSSLSSPYSQQALSPVSNVQQLPFVSEEQPELLSQARQTQHHPAEEVLPHTPDRDVVLEADVAVVTEAAVVYDEEDAVGGDGDDDDSQQRRNSPPKVARAHQAGLADFLENRTLQVGLGVLLCFVLVIAAVVGVSVALGNSDEGPDIDAFNSSSESKSTTNVTSTPTASPKPPTVAPTTSPTRTPKPSAAPITEFPSSAPTETILIIDDLPEYTITALSNTFSPQARAYRWLEEHPKLDTLPQWRRRQYLALISIYYSVEGADAWTQDQRANYLDYDAWECNWGLNVCDGAGLIESLSLLCPTNQVAPISNDPRDPGWILPPEISMLTSLASLRVNDCKKKQSTLSRYLPTELGLLNGTLTKLEMYNNNFKGTLLPSGGPITELSSLQFLNLDFNTLQGSLPSELGLLTQLSFLSVAWNSFDGQIPSEIGQLTGLESLRVYKNDNLSGQVPSEIALLTKLGSLAIENTNLVGTLPAGMCSRTNRGLEMLRLDCTKIACPADCRCSCV